MAAEEDYSSIRVTTLRGDLKIPFNVYIKVAGKFILYCRQGDSFEGSRLQRLKEKKLRKLHISKADEIPYKQYLEESIDSAYNAKSGKPMDMRAEVIQGFQQASAEDYMDEPTNQMAYEHLRSSAQRFVEFVEKEPDALKALMAVENSDGSFAHHGVTVAAISTAMTLEMDLREGTTLHLLALGCLLHDMEHFHAAFDALKPMAELTPEQLEAYKQHALLGAKRMQTAPFVDGLVLNVVLQHEENAKGTGYPKGLREDQMDPMIMIAATANVFDRLVSFEKVNPKDALKTLLIQKMGVYPLKNLESLQRVLKSQGVLA